jgi:hypothetical protein
MKYGIMKFGFTSYNYVSLVTEIGSEMLVDEEVMVKRFFITLNL